MRWAVDARAGIGREEFVLPDGGIDADVAASEPFSGDENIDEGAVFRDGRLFASVELRYQGFVIGTGFEAEDFGFGIEAAGTRYGGCCLKYRLSVNNDIVLADDRERR